MKASRMWTAVAAMAFAAAGLAPQPSGAESKSDALKAAPAAAPAGVAVLDDTAVWRTHWTMAPALAGAGGKYKPAVHGGGPESSPPPKDWAQPEFDDSTWSFHRTVGARERTSDPRRLALVSARARFEVIDPAKVKGLQAHVDYHGGCVVYLNGKEVGRSHVSPGEVGVQTIAEDYPLMVVVPVVPYNWLGREAMVVFREEGGRLAPDFRFAQRYLDLYHKHCGPPKVLCLQLWDVGIDGDGRGARPKTMRLSKWTGDAPADTDAPIFGEAGSEATWKAVVDGARQIVKGLGWEANCLQFGTTQDAVPRKETADYFARLAPDVPWIAYSHGQQPTAPLKLGFMINPDQGGGHGNGKGWLHPRGFPNTTNHRGSLVQGSSLPAYRQASLDALMRGFSGFGGFGLDYWPIPDDKGRMHQALTHYERGGNWYRIIRGAVRTFTAPGPAGALPTVRYEILREGLQEAEAFIYVQTAAEKGSLPPDLAARCKALRTRLGGKIEAMLFEASDDDWGAEQREIYECAGAVDKAGGRK
jgi:hypothetical protein